MKSEQTSKDQSRKQARFSVTGKDRQAENADLGDTGLSGSTTGDSEINYGMGEEGVPAPGNRLGGEESALTHGAHHGGKGSDSRQHRSAVQRSGSSTQDSKKKHTEEGQDADGGGSRQERGGG
jgi:hypothetical protein